MGVIPEEFQDEYKEAVDIGLTEGFNLSELVPAWVAAVMAIRACKYAVEFNGGCWNCRIK